MDLGNDLLGEPILRRDAMFAGDDVRLRLSRDWSDGPRALVIGCNPSRAGATLDDPTCLWWMRWFRDFGFGGFDAMNLYPFVSPDPAACRKIVDGIPGGDWWARDTLHFNNLPRLVSAAKAAAQVFVCWGAIAWDAEWIEHVVEEIQTGIAPWPDLWCWGTTNDGAPKHPMARGKHRIDPMQKPILWRAGKVTPPG